MNEKETNLKKAFDYIKQFYSEISKMVLDIIDLMDKKGWTTQYNESAITDGLSKKLDKSDQWWTAYLYKNFKNDKMDSHIKGILVLLDKNTIDFPPSIICGNIYTTPEQHHKFNLWYIYDQNKDKLESLSGSALNLTATNKENGMKVKANVFALPLISITSKNDLKNNVVKKLLDIK